MNDLFLAFNETAEEMVNRLCQKWLEDRTFAIDIALTNPKLKRRVVNKLENFDNAVQKTISQYMTEKEDIGFLNPASIMQDREDCVLQQVAYIYSVLASKSFPTKPTHRQETNNKSTNYLRLVVNE